MRLPRFFISSILLPLFVLSCGESKGAGENAGGNPPETGRFLSNGGGALRDTETNFLWQQADDNVERTWEQAMDYCGNLTLGGLTGWTLPDIDALCEIVDTDFAPTIDPAFVGTKAGNYWSSTPSSTENIAWSVNFGNGLKSNAMFKNRPFYCRCVRK